MILNLPNDIHARIVASLLLAYLNNNQLDTLQKCEIIENMTSILGVTSRHFDVEPERVFENACHVLNWIPKRNGITWRQHFHDKCMGEQSPDKRNALRTQNEHPPGAPHMHGRHQGSGGHGEGGSSRQLNFSPS
jgi:hypothetical protein